MKLDEIKIKFNNSNNNKNTSSKKISLPKYPVHFYWKSNKTFRSDFFNNNDLFSKSFYYFFQNGWYLNMSVFPINCKIIQRKADEF